MTDPFAALNEAPALAGRPLCQKLLPLVCRPTGQTSAGYPYFERRTFEDFRDTIAYLFAAGAQVLDALAHIEAVADSLALGTQARQNLARGCRVARQMTRTAAITAPTDLWLMRHILGVHADLGLTGRLLAGAAIHPEFTTVQVDGAPQSLDPEQLAIDLHFLLARGIVEQYDESFRIAGHHRVRELLAAIAPIADGEPVPAAPLWQKLFSGQDLSGPEIEGLEALERLGRGLPEPRRDLNQTHWIPTANEVRTAYLLVPLVLGLRAANGCQNRTFGDTLGADNLAPQNPSLGDLALRILRAAGWLISGDNHYQITRLGARGFARAAGPFGIIQTYHPYLSAGRQILLGGRRSVWVRRGENIGASQDANRKTFRIANDALDRFCADTGFEYRVFIEHAIGRGEASRQRFERSGEENLRYFGADLEDPAIDAALSEQQAGRLPQNMVFVRRADIGKPQKLLNALADHNANARGAVMLVGNGFHEVRDQTDQAMVDVFKGYHEAGVLLLFTEENALSVDDLRATAYNTYHAGFKYVHEKSGQCLRPASPRPRPRLGPPLRAAWSECAERAGYVRLEDYSTRTRTIFPYPRGDGHNPSISVNHFFVPRPIADALGLRP